MVDSCPYFAYFEENPGGIMFDDDVIRQGTVNQVPDLAQSIHRIAMLVTVGAIRPEDIESFIAETAMPQNLPDAIETDDSESDFDIALDELSFALARAYPPQLLMGADSDKHMVRTAYTRKRRATIRRNLRRLCMYEFISCRRLNEFVLFYEL